MGIYIAVLVGALVVALGLALRAYDRSAGAWGEVRVPLGESGEGAYRAAPRFDVVTPHEPGRVLAAGVLARVWAALTLLVFVPAGAVAALIFFRLGEHHLFSGLCSVVLAGLLVSGLGVALGLVRAVRRIEKRGDRELVRTVVTWSVVHHVLVGILFVLEGLVIDPQAATMALVVVAPVCALGIGVALALRRANERAEVEGALA